MPNLTEAEAQRIKHAIRHQNGYFFRHVLGTDPWAKQREIAWAMKAHKYVTCRSCNGAGKTWTIARAGLEFLYSYKPSIVIGTAPTFTQVQDNMFGEVHSAYEQSKLPLGGRLNQTELRLGAKHYFKGRSTNQEANFQGIHERNIAFIADEAPGIKDPIFNAIDGSLTSNNAHLLLIGNPTSVTGRFYQSFKLPFYYKIHISAFDTPNFTLNGIRNLRELVELFENPDKARRIIIYKPELTTPQWVYEKYLQWGEDSPMFQARVMGNFPVYGDKALFPINWLDAASTDEREQFVLANMPANPMRYYGNDVARYGKDASSVIGRLDYYVYLIEELRQLDNVELAQHDMQIHDTQPGRWSIDIDGLGTGTHDTLKHAGLEPGEIIFGVHGSGKPIDPQFENLRAEMYWNLREAFKAGLIYIPDHEELKFQLSNMEYFVNKKGKIQIQSKDDISTLIGRSPDLADALAMCFNGYMNTANSAIAGLNLNLYKKFNA